MVSVAEFEEMRANLAAMTSRVDAIEAAAMQPAPDAKKAAKSKKRKRSSSSGKPSKPGVANAYMFWLNQMGMRDTIKSDCMKQDPSASMTDVARRAGELWRNMSTDDKASVDAQWKAFNEEASRLDANARNHWITELGMGEKFKAQLLKKDPGATADDITRATVSAWESLPKAARKVVEKQYNDFKDLKKDKQKKIILFSPSAASFDQFKNFEVRGLYFNKIIKKYIN